MNSHTLRLDSTGDITRSMSSALGILFIFTVFICTSTSVHAAAATKGTKKKIRVELKNGNILEGKLIEINSTRLVISVRGGTSIFPTSSIKKIDDLTSAVPKKKKKPVPEVVEEEDGAPSEALLHDQLRVGPRKGTDPSVKAAEVEKKKQPAISPKTRSLLAALKKKEQADAKGEELQGKKPALPKEKLDRLDPKTAPKGFDKIVDLIGRSQFKHAAFNLRQIGNQEDRVAFHKADKESKLRFNSSLSELLTQCYLKAGCKRCAGKGLQVCPKCKGCGYLVRWVTIERGEPGGVAPGVRRKISTYIGGFKLPENDKTFRRVRICHLCRGHGTEVCTDCSGTRRHWIEPSSFERETYAEKLLSLGDQALYKSERSFGDTRREPPPTYKPRDGAKMLPMLQQVWLRDSISKVKSDILRLHRSKGYYEAAIKADPSLTFRTKRDLDEELTRLDTRMHHLYGELTERQLTYADNRTERRLDETVYGEGKSQNSRFGEVLGDD